MCSSPVLQSPNFSNPFILQTDASDRGVGAVVSQLDDQGDDHPIAYFSRKLLPREEHHQKGVPGDQAGCTTFPSISVGEAICDTN